MGVHLIWGLLALNKGFTVKESRWQIKNLTNSDCIKRKFNKNFTNLALNNEYPITTTSRKSGPENTCDNK